MNKEELLEEAKRRYPVGTKVVCLFGEDVCIVSSFDYICNETEIWFVAERGNGVLVYDNGKWAHLASDIAKANKQYTKEDVVEFANYAIRETWNPTTIEESKTTTELFDLWVKSKEETK